VIELAGRGLETVATAAAVDDLDNLPAVARPAPGPGSGSPLFCEVVVPALT
jgi:hypothetical protein